ncbi:MAG: ABC transporter permease [Crenarchaeota archaeon]|mgnify:CR=1 FL=1|nr:ABC transporter permease [Thermoproteota archaeon]
MLKGFTNILIKELKELIRDPKILVGMIVVPLIMFPVLGLVLTYAQETAQSEAQNAQLLVINNDNGNWSQTLINYLTTGMNVSVIDNLTPQQVIDQNLMEEYNVTTFLEIPGGFSNNFTEHINGDFNITATVNTYGSYQGGGIFSGLGSSVASVYVASFNRVLAPNIIQTSSSTIIKGQIQYGVDPSQLSSLMLSQAIALPMTIMILLTYAMQIAATSVAQEKEEKTLETLLTVPVDRFAILMGKLSSTIIVAGVAAVAIMIGYNYMLSGITSSITSGTSIDLVQLGLVPSSSGYLLLGISLFVTLLSALALAVIMSAFSEDVRGAQALVGYVYPVIFLPALVMIYLDINTLPVGIQAIFYAIPYSHPIIASKAIVLGNYSTVIFGIAYVSILTVAIMYIASRLFSTEKILTAKLRMSKKRKNIEANA